MSLTVCGPLPADSSTDEVAGSPIELGNGSAGEIARLLESFRPYLVAIAQAELPSALGGKFGASDVVQDTIIKGLERFEQFEGTTREEFGSWLRAILRSHLADVVDAFATKKRNIFRERPGSEGVADPWQASPSKAAASQEEEERLAAALESLSEEARRVILLRHREKFTFAQVGMAIGKSEEAARKVWVRALAALQSSLSDPAL